LPVFGHLAEAKGMRPLILGLNFAAKKLYHLRMRRIVFVSNKGKLTFLTNDLKSPARRACRTNVICELYRIRWEIEVFFKCVKQNLKIKRFYGHNKNAIEH